MNRDQPSAHPNRSISVLSQAVNFAVFLGAIAFVLLQFFPATIDTRLWPLLFAVYVVTNRAQVRLSGIILMSAAFAFGIIATLVLEVSVLDVLQSASFLFGFIMVIQYVGATARGSPLVLQAARAVVSQPEGRRYLFVSFGAHGLSLVLQMGGMLLVMALMSDRLKDEALDTMRSLATGAMRGFAATSLWSPLSLAILVIFTGVSGVSYMTYLPIGLAVTVCYLTLGYWMEHMRRKKSGTRSAPQQVAESGNLVSLLPPVLGLVVCASATTWFLDLRMIEGVFIAALMLAVISGGFAFVTGGRNLKESINTITQTTSSCVNELSIVVSAIFIGTVAGLAVAQFQLLGAQLSARDAATVAGLIPLFMLAGGIIAMNPLVTATFLVGTLDVVWPESAKLWLALSLTWGWAISTCGAPYTANMLMSSQLLSQPPHVLAIVWNGRFTLITIGIACSVAAAGAYFAAV